MSSPSPLKTIYIARHGFRLNWVNSNWKSPTGMPRDAPLAAYGESQARELAAHLLSLPLPERPTAVFSSPFYRCLQTSKPIAEALQVPLYAEHAIGEWYSPVVPGSGLHPRPGPAETLLPFFPELDSSWTSTYLPDRKGEQVDQLYARIDQFLEHFVRRVEQQSKHTCILFVSHAATVIALARQLQGDPSVSDTLRVGCCSLSTFKRKDEDSVLGAWEPVQLATADFLANGVERDWGITDIEVEDGLVVEDPGEKGTEDEVDDIAGLQTWAASRM